VRILTKKKCKEKELKKEINEKVRVRYIFDIAVFIEMSYQTTL